MRVNGCWGRSGTPKEKYFHLEDAKWELFFIQVGGNHVSLLKYFLLYSQKEQAGEMLQTVFQSTTETGVENATVKHKSWDVHNGHSSTGDKNAE